MNLYNHPHHFMTVTNLTEKKNIKRLSFFFLSEKKTEKEISNKSKNIHY